MLVVTVATKRNSFLDEWETTVKRLGYKYAIIGIGEKWESFHTKNKLMNRFLRKLNPDEIIIFTDSYDLLFLRPPEILLEKYKKLCLNRELLIGYETNCSKQACDERYIQKCGFKNHSYLNTGFIMGPVKEILKGYQHSVDNNIMDDQRGWGNYLYTYCPKVYIDTKSEIVLNLFPKIFISNKTNKPMYKEYEIEIENNLIHNIDDNNYPIAVHMPAQDFDLGKRSETIRNALIPTRKPIKKIEYFKGMMNRIGTMIKNSFDKDYN